MALPVRGVVAPEAHLYLWTTGSFMVEAHEMARAWGFEPKGIIPWVKIKRCAAEAVADADGDLNAAVRMGMGRYIRWCSEFVVFAVRGKLPTDRNDVNGVILAERARHSEKPGRFYDMARSLSPAPRLELFARKQSEGFVPWGNEVEAGPTGVSARPCLTCRKSEPSGTCR